ncbi:MAG TPA: DoxX family protein [Allosphingosinicella sp.]|nr:DoxX family protein [Allosphingosinicella sp.]
MAGNTMLAILRIVSGLLFLQHGAQKFLSFPPGPMSGIGLQFNSMPAYAGAIELVCGLLIVIGLFTRIAAFLASGTMAVAFWFYHFSFANPFPINNGGELAIIYCFVFLYLVFAGAGPLSVDAARGRRSPPHP